ncbi:MAG TPA: DUF1759 domain-containing protein, partial [Ghiorsea sp.]|nr:DUF1759 domain-containing protein [Ghiorsea sp.]
MTDPATPPPRNAYNLAQVATRREATTRVLKRVEGICKEAGPDFEYLKGQIGLLELTYNSYATAWLSYEDECLATLSEGIRSEQEAHVLMESTHYAKLGEFKTRLRALKPTPECPTPAPTDRPFKTRLPDLKLTEFSGEVDEWDNFWDTFQALVHQRTDLDNVTKMTYLKSSLKGKAADVIKGFKVSANDYQPALQTLKSNFADPEYIKRVLVRKLLNIKAPRYSKSELCRFHIEYETLIR